MCLSLFFASKFPDRISDSDVRVLIDHIFASQDIEVAGDRPGKVWNPWEVDELKEHKEVFKNASDHFPVTLDIVV